MSESSPLSIEEFEPVKAIIFGALDRIPKKQRGETTKYPSVVDGVPYVVTSYEEKMKARDLSYVALHNRIRSEEYRVRSPLMRGSEELGHRVSAITKPSYTGIVNVSPRSMGDVETNLFYKLRRQQSGLIIAARATLGSVTDPEEFAYIVQTANYDRPLGILTELTDDERQKLTAAHAPLINRINHLISRDGIGNTDLLGNDSLIIPTRVARYDFGDEVVSLSRRLDKPDKLLVMRSYLNADSDTVNESFVSSYDTDDNYLTILGLAVNKQPVQQDVYSGANAMPQPTIDHLMDLFDQV